jgi:hypothetical protein
VIEISYAGGRTTGDQRFFEPDGIDLIRSVACSLTATTSSEHSSSAYQNSLSVDASVSGKVAFVAFSASVDYQKTSSTVSSGSQTRYSTAAMCAIYQATVLSYTTLNLTQEFRNGVATLPAAYDSASYKQFTDVFGTHYTSKMTMGAKYVSSLEFSSADSQNMTELGVNVAAAVQVSFIIGHVGGSVDVKYHKKDYTQMSQFHSTTNQVVVGTAPPKDSFASAPLTPVPRPRSA